jgi:hypothetical protein
MRRFAWLLSGALAFGVGSVFAVDIDADFDELDVNMDGYVSVDETKDETALSQYWYKFDENKDGALDTAEFSAFEEADIDDIEPWPLRHHWYGSVGTLNLGASDY